MKRKLNDDNIPTAAEAEDLTSAVDSKNSPAAPTFSALGLDSRLLQAIAKENFSSLTPVQAKGIPLALENRDVLGRCPSVHGSSCD